MMTDALYFDHLDSPLGRLHLIADDVGLRRICFPHERHPRADDTLGLHAPARLAFARRQLDEYFAGRRRRFDLPLQPIGTPFQRRVWEALASIPYGQTWTYADLARHIGRPGAMRAVGGANGRNPLPIVVPCHRVIGSDGSLTGFAGGVELKARLLALEGIVPDRSARWSAATPA